MNPNSTKSGCCDKSEVQRVAVNATKEKEK